MNGYMKSELADLAGDIVKRVWINKVFTKILFDLDSGRNGFLYFAQGDCCSESWVEHINGINALIGYRIVDTQTTENEETDEKPKVPSYLEDDKIKKWKETIITTNGRVDIELRNRSNGYYQGCLVRQNFDRIEYNNEKWAEVSHDF